MVQAIRQRSAYGGRTTGPVNAVFAARSLWTPYTGIWNSADKAATAVLSDNDYTLTAASSGLGGARGTVIMAERSIVNIMLVANPGGSGAIGIASSTANVSDGPNVQATVWAYYSNNGNKFNNNNTAYGTSYTLGDVVTIARAGPNLWFAKNGVWQASGDPLTGASPAFTNLSGILYPFCADVVDTTASVYTIVPIPAGFV